MKLTSLRGRLRWMIIALLVLFLLPLAFYSFYRTSDEMAVLSDARLAEAAHTVVVDFDDPLRPVGRCAAWAALWGAEHRRPGAAEPPSRAPRALP